MRLVGFLLFIIINQSLGAQGTIGSWQNHQSLNGTICLSKSQTSVYVASGSGLFSYNLDDNSLRTYSKSLPLSDIELSAITFNAVQNTLIIGYANGNVDLLSDAKIINLNDIKTKNFYASKKINSIFDDGDFAYLACAFGLVKLDVKKTEIKETYLITSSSDFLNVYDVAILDEKIWVVTSDGVYSANVNDANLQDFNSWKKILGKEGNGVYNAIAIIDDKVLVNYYKPGNGSLGSLISTTGEVDGMYSFQKLVTKINYTDQSIYLICSDEIRAISKSGETLQVVDNYLVKNEALENITPRDMLMMEDEIFISDMKYGLVNYTPQDAQLINPLRPGSNYVKHLSLGVNKLIVSTGSFAGDIEIPAHLHIWENRSWSTINSVRYNNKALFSILKTAQHPNNENVFYAASWGWGLFRYEDNKLDMIYNEENSPLQKYQNWRNWVSGVTFDKDGVLWMTNSFGTPSLHAKNDDDEWFSYDYPGISGTSFNGADEFLTDMFIDSRNWKWVVMSVNPLFIFDTNNTLTETQDDLYRGPKTNFADTDPRNAGQLLIWDENGEVITDAVYSLAEDKMGIFG